MLEKANQTTRLALIYKGSILAASGVSALATVLVLETAKAELTGSNPTKLSDLSDIFEKVFAGVTSGSPVETMFASLFAVAAFHVARHNVYKPLCHRANRGLYFSENKSSLLSAFGKYGRCLVRGAHKVASVCRNSGQSLVKTARNVAIGAAPAVAGIGATALVWGSAFATGEVVQRFLPASALQPILMGEAVGVLVGTVAGIHVAAKARVPVRRFIARKLGSKNNG